MIPAKKILSETGEPLLSARKVARRLQCASDYVGKLCREGKLKGVRVQNAWFVDEASISAFEATRAEAKVQRATELATIRREEGDAYRKSQGLPALKSTLASHPSLKNIVSDHVRTISQHISSRSKAFAIGGALLFASVTIAAGIAAPFSGGVIGHTHQQNLAASLAQVDSPFFGAHPFSISTSASGTSGFLSGILAFLFGNKTPVALSPEKSSGRPSLTSGEPVGFQTFPQQVQPTSTRPSSEQVLPVPRTVVTNSYPVIERTIEHVVSGVSEEELTRKLSILQNSITQQIFSAVNGVTTPSYSSGGVTNNIALTQIIDKLDGVTITNSTVNGLAGLTDADIPDGITASNYLPLAGGTLTGALTVSGATSTLSGIVISTLNCSGFGNSGKLTTDALGNVVCSSDISSSGSGSPGGSDTYVQYNDATSFGGSAGFTFDKTTGLLTVPQLLLTSSTTLKNFTFGSATGTAATTTSFFTSKLTVSGTASTTNLIISSLGFAAGQCLTTDSSGTVISQSCGTGASFAFTPTQNYGALANSTSTPIWFTQGLQASSTSHFTNADFVNATTSSLYIASLTGPLQAVNGQVSASSTLSVAYGGTGIQTTPIYGNLLVGNANGAYSLTATSSLGLLASTSLHATAPLSFNASTGIFTISQSGISTDGYLSTTDFNTFNNKISSTSLSDGSGISYNSGTGVITNTIGFSFIPTQNYGALANSTSTPLWFTTGLQASSTSHFTNADFVNATTTSLYIASLTGPLQAIGGQVSATSTLSSVYGGTGFSTYTPGDILYANANGVLTTLGVGSVGQVLKSSGTLPSWGADNTGSGGSGVWATTTDSLAIYPSTVGYVVLVGTSATSSTGNIFEVNGTALFRNAVVAYGTISGPTFTATTSTASIFPFASTTAITSTNASTTNLVISSLGTAAGQCLTTDSSGTVTTQSCGTGASFAFTPTQNFGALANSTSTPIWFTQGLQASSTSHFVNADFINATSTNATSTNLFSTNALVTNAFIVNGTTTNASSTNLFSTSALFTNLFAVNATTTNSTTTNFSATNASTSVLRVSNNATIGGLLGVGTTSPTALLSVHAAYSSVLSTLFAVASTSNSGANTTLFSISNIGSTTLYQIPSALLKTDSNGTIIAAVAGTDYAIGGTANDFTWSTNFGVLTAATSSILNATLGIFASSTSHFVNADFINSTSTNATTTNFAATNELIQNSFIVNGTTTNATTTNFAATNASTSVLTVSNNASVGGKLGIGTTTPFATLGIYAASTSVNQYLFAIASTSNNFATTTLFSIDNTGLVNFLTLSGTNATFTNSTSTNATSTNFFSTNALHTNLFVVNATSTNASSTNLFSTSALITNSFIVNGTTTNATTTNFAATNASTSVLTVSNNATVGGKLGVGTTSPFALLSVHAASSSILSTLFAVASTSNNGAATTLFSIDNTGTSTLLGLASSTGLVVSGLNAAACDVKSDLQGHFSCGTDATGGGGGGFDFTPDTNFGALANSTSTPIWFTAGLQASSTSHFVNADFIAATTSALAVTGIASTTQFYGSFLSNCNSGNVLTWANGAFGCAADQTATGQADPFIFANNYALITAATTSPIWAQNGLFASSTSHFANVDFINATTSSLYIASLNGPLQANQGQVSATSSIGVLYGGTGLTIAPSYGNLLVGNSSGGYTLSATSSLGLISELQRDWKVDSGYLTPTTTIGILVTASSTIGNGTPTGGLTVSGGATTTGDLFVQGNSSTTNLYVSATVSGAGLTSCSSSADKLLWSSATGKFSCGNDQSGSGSGSDLNWTFFNNSGVRLTTSTNQVLLSNPLHTSTSTLSKLEVYGGAAFDSATTTNFYSSGQSVFDGFVGIGSTSPSAKLSVGGGNIVQTAVGNPTLATSTTVGGATYGIYVSGRYAYVAAESAGLKILDISTPSRPTSAGTFSSISGAHAVIVASKYAYVSDSGTGLNVIDISNPSSPTLVSALSTAGSGFTIALSGKYIYAVDVASSILRIIDVSDPSAPFLAGNYTTAGGSPYAVAVQGKYAFVGDQGDGKMYVLDITNPAKPNLISTFPGLTTATSIYLSGKYAYLTDAAGLHVLNISNPASVSQTGSYSGAFYSVSVGGDYAYLTDPAGNLTVVDVSNPAVPALVGSASTGGTPHGLFVSGKYAYVTTESTTVKIVDINGIKAPAANIGSLESNTANISDNLNVGGDGYFGGGLNVGISGIFSRGGLSVYGTTTLQNFTALNGTTTNATSTNFFVTNASTSVLRVSNNATIGGLLGVGTTSPTALLSVHAASSSVLSTLFAVASTSNSGANTTLFSISNIGSTTLYQIPSALLKTDSNGTIIAAVAGTDYAIGGTANDFTWTTNYGVLTAATSSILNATVGIFASSTSHFVNADFINATSTNATSTNLFSQNALFTNAFIVNGTTTNATTTNFAATNASTSVLTVSNNASVGGKLGIGTTTPFATLGIYAASTSVNQYLFAIASTTNNFATTTLFSIDNTGLVSFITLSGTNATFVNSTSTNATSTNFFATKALISNLFAVNGTTTNATSTNLFSTNALVSSFFGVNATTTNATSTFLTITSAASTSALTVSNNQTIGGTLGVGTTTAAAPWATLSVTAASSSILSTLFSVASTSNNGATTNFFSISNTGVVSFLTLSGTNATFTNSTSTNATSTNLFSTNALITNGFIVNGTTTNATTTNFSATNASTSVLTVSNNASVGGKLGVGTTSPYALLSILAASSSVNQYLFAVASTSNAGVATTLFNISNTGLVGIGTTTPYAKLAVQASVTQSNPVFEVASSSTATKFLSVAGTGFGTTTLSGLNISASATSTSNVGYNITSGCFSVSGACVGSGSSSGGVVLSSIYATSSVGTTTVNFNGAAGSAASFSAAVLTLPSDTTYYVVEVWGGGGGGGAVTTNDGKTGATTCYSNNAIACVSVLLKATGGVKGSSDDYTPGAGGFGSSGDVNLSGESGQPALAFTGDNYGGAGGSAPGGGAGAPFTVSSAAGAAGDTFGGGGAGGANFSTLDGGSGGGAGGYSKKLISNTTAAKFTVGAGGAGGAAGTDAGGAGGSGGMVIHVYTPSGIVTNGSVDAGTAGQVAYYAADGTTISGTSLLTIGSGNVTVPFASSTAITISGTGSTTNFIVSSAGGVGTRCAQFGADGTLSANASACGSGSGSFPFTTLTAYGTTTAATTTVLWAQFGIFASSTSHFVNADFINSTSTNATSTNLFSTNALFTNSFIVNGTTTNATSTNFSATNASTSVLTVSNNASVGGKLGIGTTTPFATLGIYAASTSLNQYLFAIASTTNNFATTTLFSIDNTGLVNFLTLSGTNATFTNSTSTNATSTNLFSTRALFTNAFIVNGTTTNATSTNFAATNASTSVLTVSNNASVGGKLGIGTTTPFATLGIYAASTSLNQYLFAIASTTNNFATTTLFSIDNTGSTTIAGGLAVNGAGTSTFLGNLNVLGQLKVGTGSIYLNSTATSTLTAGISASALTVSGFASTTSLIISNAGGTAGCATFSTNGTISNTGTACGSGGGGGFDFTVDSNYGTLTNATSTPVWFKVGLQASSTSHFTDADFVNATTSSFAITGIATTTSFYGSFLSNCSGGFVLTWNSGAFGCTPDQTGVGQAPPFIWENNFGVVNTATTSVFFAKSGINASSTVNFGNAGVNSQLLFDSSTGRLGLGTSSPWGELSVNPNGIGSGPAFVVGSSTKTSFIVTGNNSSGFGTSSPWGKLSVDTSLVDIGTPTFVVGSSSRTDFIVTVSGNSGVGTSSPWANFAIGAPSGSTNTMLFAIGSTTSAGVNSALFSVDNTGTSTLLGLASSTGLVVSGLNAAACDVKSDSQGHFSCGTDATGAGGGGFDFTADTNYGALTNSTSTPVWFKVGLQASSTSHFANADFINSTSTNATSTNLFSTNALITNLFVVNGTTTNATTTNFSATNASTSVLTVSNNASVGGNLGIGTTTPFGTLSVVTNKTSDEFSPAFVLATTSTWNNQGQSPLIFAYATTTGTQDYARVAIGTSTGWGSGGVRDQLTVAGRINSTWTYLQCDAAGITDLGTAYSKDTTTGAHLCGDFGYDFSIDGSVNFQTSAYPAFMRLLASDTASATSSEGGTIRTFGRIAPATSSPVMEARVRIPSNGAPSNISTTTRYIIGLTDEAWAANPTTLPDDGAYFLATSTNQFWNVVVRVAGTEVTNVATTVSTSTQTFSRLRVELSSTSVVFLINGIIVATVNPARAPTPNLVPMVQAAFSGKTPGMFGSPSDGINGIDIAYIKVWIDDPADDASAPTTFGGAPVPTFDRIEGADIAEAGLVDNPLNYMPGMLVSNATSTISGSTTPMVRKSSGRYDQDLLGAVSTSPHDVLGQENAGTIRVAMVGRVPVIVSLENGAINQGDRITASSIGGIGMKATRPGTIVGTAIQTFGSATSTPEVICDNDLATILQSQGIALPPDTCVASILVSLNVGSDMTVGNIFQDATDVITTLAGGLAELGNAALSRGAELTKFVVGQLVAKIAIIGDLFADHITATVINADQVNAKTLCLDDLCVTKTQLQQLLDNAGATSSPPPGSGPPTGGGGSGTTTPDTEPPIIILNGNNPATILVGTTYVDLGGTVTDNVDQNLGLYASVDGGATSTPDTIYIDTSAEGTHFILFSATDGAGNTGNATRTVIVASSTTP
jgi:hypothetical protein